jgi:hypothetical protein
MREALGSKAVHEECQVHILSGKEPPFVFES